MTQPTNYRAVLEQALNALGTCRIMAKDADGNYTREVTPKLITDALTAGRAALAQMQGEAWKHSCNVLCVDRLELWIDHCPHCGKPAPSHPQASEPAPSTAWDARWAEYPEKCPITRRDFFMVIEHPKLGMVPTYGGPYDSYTIPVMEGEPDQPFQERELRCERYDHDFGGWVEDEGIPLRVISESALEELQAAALLSAPTLPVELTESELMKCIAQAGCFGTVKLSYESGPYYLDRPTLNATKLARAILAAARTQPELVPMTDDQIQGIYIRTYNIGHHGRNFENAFARAIEAAHGITNKAKEPQS